MYTYRAAYYGATVFTSPEHSSLPDDQLRLEALAEMHRAGIFGPMDDIYIGDWTAHGEWLGDPSLINADPDA